MRNYATLLIIAFMALCACSESKFNDKNIELKALNIAEKLDSANIAVFYKWGIGHRGNADIFIKYSDDTNTTIYSYSCFYYKNSDTIKLTIRNFENFKQDFACDIVMDTSNYYLVEILKYNTSLRVSGVDKNGHDQIFIESPLKKIFKANDPFETFKTLSDRKDSLGISGVSYRADIGNFIQFYLSSEYILTYLPDNGNLNPGFKNVWLETFATGRTIKKNWNLRKLDTPLEEE